jgi:Tfp pilus assembly protein PilF
MAKPFDASAQVAGLTLNKDANASENAEYKKLVRLSFQYLVNAYAYKLNDPAKAERVLRDMIRDNPNDRPSYVVLAELYEAAGVYVEAERVLQAARAVAPNDASADAERPSEN